MINLVGMGNPLLDVIMHVDFPTFEETGVPPDTMNLIDSTTMRKLQEIPEEKYRSPGGSCANTLRGIAWIQTNLGNTPSILYMGAVGRDDEGKHFEDILAAQGVCSLLAHTDEDTGISTILVTPDHKRTMFTHLGACREFTRDHVDFSRLDTCEFVHTTGYMWDTENQEKAAKELIMTAKEKGIRVSFDLADPFVAQRYGEKLREWLPGKVDYLFANREELSMLTGIEDDARSMEEASRFGGTVIMKTGSEGCQILCKEEIIRVAVDKVPVVDTTGAGDSFASGYLYGLMQGYSHRICGEIANAIASRIVTIEGCDYTRINFDNVRKAIPEN